MLLHESLSKGADIIRGVVKTLPDEPGVYQMLNKNEKVLYVGKAKNLKKRVVSYTHTSKLPNRLQRMVAETVSMKIVTTHTEIEALLLENNLIKKLQPHYNVLLKDDKSFPYILLTKDHDFPRAIKHRGPQTVPGNYYGPFANIQAVDEALLILQKIFKIRNCTNHYFLTRKRPCLQYDIKRCTAPCVNKISKEEYDQNVKLAKDFLMGRTDIVQKELSSQMLKESDTLNFEKAAQIRDVLKMITEMQARQRIHVNGIVNADVIAIAQLGGYVCVQVFFFRYGRNFGTDSFFLQHAQDETPSQNLTSFINQFYQERAPAPLLLLSHNIEEKELVQEALTQLHKIKPQIEIPKLGVKNELVLHALKNAEDAINRKIAQNDNLQKMFSKIKEIFHLETNPQRVEIFDNSHLQGSYACGVMVVATPDGFDKKAYRKFTPKEASPDDDFGMMKEFLKRRFQHKEDWELPDLLLIDGGKGQISAIESLRGEMDIKTPIVGIAKGKDRNAGREKFIQIGREPFQLEENDPFLYFLQRLRDEAHRFAIGTHRNKREKALSKSVLDDIPGIGPLRKKKLLLHFGSAKSVARAGIADLSRVEGINHAVAKKIYDYFHER